MSDDKQRGRSDRLNRIHQDWQRRLAQINPVTDSTEGALVVLLAPSGAGKTSHIGQWRSEGRALHHINRDGITKGLLEQAGIDPRPMQRTPEQLTQINQILTEQQLPAYFEAVRAAMSAKGSQAVVVDYPPGDNDAWLDETVRLARQSGRRVSLEGLHVSPETGVLRVLERNAQGLARPQVEALLGDASHLCMTLATYQNFPRQYLHVAAQADDAVLFDNRGRNGDGMPVIATWQSGQRQIDDRKAYQAFQSLQNIDLSRARYTGKIVGEDQRDGITRYQIAIETGGSFKPRKKTGLARQAKPN